MQNIIPGFLAVMALVLSYIQVLQYLVQQWLNDDNFSHGLLVPPIALYLAWQKRNQLKRAIVRADWRGVSLLIAAALLYVVGELGAELFTVRFSFLLFLVGIVWFLYGPDVLRMVSFPLFFLLFMLPLPGFIYSNLTFPLQLLSTEWSERVLHLAGVTAYREGNVIDLGFMTLQVVEACNGLRFILPLLTLGLLISYLSSQALWKRVFLVLASIPVALLANVLRIGGTGILAAYWNPGVAEGFFHSFSGWILFIVCFGFFALLNFFLRLLPPRGSVTSPQGTYSPNEKIRPSPSLWIPTTVAIVWILVTPWTVETLGRVPPVCLKKDLGDFPLTFDGWLGIKETLDPEIWKQVGGQQYVLVDYQKNGERPVNFYVVYYEYQRKAGEFVHSPRLCLPGEGWFVQRDQVRVIPLDSPVVSLNGSLSFNELIVSKHNSRRIVYFWYQGRGRNFTNEFAAKFFMVWDGLWRRRTDGALVRLVAPLRVEPDPQDEAAARRTLDAFAVRAATILDEYLP